VEQRRLRVGDIVDDYCPRERRVTDHAVVAMVADAIQQTRCTACDAEHAYKGGSAPKRRRKESPDALYNEVLSGMSDQTDAAPSKVADPGASTVSSNGDMSGSEEGSGDAPTEGASRDEGSVRRSLIRATLPRPEGIPKERPAPDFTIRQPGSRGFRDQGRAGRGHRFGASQGGGRFNRGGAHPQHGGRQKKRSR
jgi:hypothetical protein